MTEYDSPTHEQHQDEAEAPRTIRQGLRDRRAKVAEKLYTDRAVPRLDGFFVRFRAIDGARLEAIQKQATEKKNKNPERSVIGNANVLAECCLGVYQVAAEDEDPIVETDVDGKTVGLVSVVDDDDPEAPKFDKRLARELGISEASNAASVVRALYLTDGDVTAEANAIIAWSGFAGEQMIEEYAGN